MTRSMIGVEMLSVNNNGIMEFKECPTLQQVIIKLKSVRNVQLLHNTLASMPFLKCSTSEYLLQACVHSRRVSTLGICPLQACVHSMQVSTLGRCPLQAYVHSMQVATLDRCLLQAFVNSRQVATIVRCPLQAGIHSRHVSTLDRCPLQAGVHSRQVSTLGICPLYAGGHSRQVPTLGICQLQAGGHYSQVSTLDRYFRQEFILGAHRCLLQLGVYSKQEFITCRCSQMSTLFRCYNFVKNVLYKYFIAKPQFKRYFI